MSNERNESRNKNILIGALLAIILIMGVGYAAFSQQLTINGTASIDSNWAVEITEIQVYSTSGSGANVSSTDDPTNGTQVVNSSTAQFSATLQSPGDSVTYEVTVTNKGTIKAELANIQTAYTNEDAPITFIHTAVEGSTIEANNTYKFNVTVSYDDVSEQPSTTTKTLTLTLDYKEATT